MVVPTESSAGGMQSLTLSNLLCMMQAKSVVRSSHAAREVRAPLWTPVIEGVLLAYNAYWDVRAIQGMEPPFIRVLTTALDYGEAQRDHFQDYAGRFDESGFQCRLHFSSSSRKDELVPAVLHAHTTYDGTASFDFLCDVRSALAAGSRRQLPRAVSLACTECTQPWAIEVRGGAVGGSAGAEPFLPALALIRRGMCLAAIRWSTGSMRCAC